ncbi:MAG: CDP-6-deoxy-delta-3,4-glucoseen reductase [Nevskia sp.]|nr:CDP-6-deoxy-delta-3,4-glucoseen reductase [Nevskia sp.]
MSTSSPLSLEASLAARSDVWRGVHGARPPTEASGIASLDTRLPGGGWPLGALSELLLEASGIGELQLALPLLVRLTQAGRHVAFVAAPQLPYAPALARAGLVLTRTLVVDPQTSDEAANEAIGAAEQLLRTPAYGAVLAWMPNLREADARRLQLAAESSGNIGLIYRPARVAGSANIAALRLKLARRETRLEIEILKVRGGRSGARFFADEPAPLRAVISVDRRDAA